MANHAQIADRWAERATGQTDKPELSGGRYSNVFVREGRIYSYGSHFEMGRYVKPTKGAPFFLLNGDSYSVTTSRHQSHVREAVRKTGAASAIVPYSALERAGVDRDTIVPVEVLPERWDTTTHSVTVPELVTLAHRAASGAFGWDDSNARRMIGGRNVLTGNDGETGALSITRELPLSAGPDGARYSVSVCKRSWNYTTNRYEDHAPRVSYYRNGHGLTLVSETDGVLTYETHRHFLGGCVFRATVTGDKLTKCTGTPSGDGIWCQVCGSHVTDKHRQDGYHVVRDKTKRAAYFVSGWDENETRPLYFLAELPTGAKPTSYAHALDILAPAEVHAARAAGLAVIRQGDIFAVPCTADDGPPAIAAKYAEKGAPVPLDGTGRHVCSELVTCADGRTARVYARGTMRHTGGEHKRVKLDGWHRIYRNTVPMRPVIGWPSPNTAASPRAWTIAGRVD